MASNANVADVDQNLQTDNAKTTVHTDVNRDGQEKNKEMDEDLTDFLEFQLEDHKRSRNKGTSVQVVEHDFKKVEAKYNEKKHTELQQIKNDKQKLKESEKKEASKSTISLTSSLDKSDSDLEEYDDWKLMEVEIEFNDLYDFRGRNLKEVFNADISNMSKTAEADKGQSGWTSKLGLKNNKSTGISDSNTSIPDALERHLANGSSRSSTTGSNADANTGSTTSANANTSNSANPANPALNPFAALFGAANSAQANAANRNPSNSASSNGESVPPNPFANPEMWNLLGAMARGSNEAAQTRAADNRPPEEIYQTQLRQLNDMGFFDFDKNVKALRRSGGSVQGAIEELLNGSV